MVHSQYTETHSALEILNILHKDRKFLKLLNSKIIVEIIALNKLKYLILLWEEKPVALHQSCPKKIITNNFIKAFNENPKKTSTGAIIEIHI